MLNGKSWVEPLSTEETNEVCVRLSRALIKEIPERFIRERIAGLLDSNDFRGICDLEIDYTSISVTTAIRVRQVCAFFQKRGDLDFGIDRDEAAYKSFLESEKKCLETNTHFWKCRSGNLQNLPGVEPVLYLAQRKVDAILGEVPTLESLRPRFGPGATTSIQKKNACHATKLGGPFACSEELIPYVSSVLEETPSWIPFGDQESCHVPVEIHAGKLGFAPKSWKTSRTIVVEPVLNSFVQLGVGDYIAGRLRRIGQNLRDQTRNQRAARRGSLDGSLATLDLSSASDTISIELVRDLLPLPWFESLSALRTGTVVYNGCLLKLQKFSSMGNGFTFPLESLIFYSLAYGTCCYLGVRVDEIEVYGDDIIVPTEAVPLLTRVLSSCGFTINPEKSFSSGPFRESCGADYLKGINIRPCYLKETLSGVSLFKLHNFFRRGYEDEVADLLLTLIPPELQIFGPDGFGDGHLLLPFGADPRTTLTPCKRELGYAGFTFETYSLRTKYKKLRDDWGMRVLPAYSIYMKETACDDDAGTSPVVIYHKDNCFSAVPGARGYKRIKIYTFGL